MEDARKAKEAKANQGALAEAKKKGAEVAAEIERLEREFGEP